MGECEMPAYERDPVPGALQLDESFETLIYDLLPLYDYMSKVQI